MADEEVTQRLPGWLVLGGAPLVALSAAEKTAWLVRTGPQVARHVPERRQAAATPPWPIC
ncbi:hypothetical protein ACFYRY_30420 [Streptomyces sp. NPDC005263]|uniref:hypothetical protein n=1 Tax=Streptomyces sp. NPDC005263 TaxID=3364711 RepID=UPI0036B828EF